VSKACGDQIFRPYKQFKDGSILLKCSFCGEVKVFHTAAEWDEISRDVLAYLKNRAVA
jgi:uncharacterized C2H2 Zn-finger protein